MSKVNMDNYQELVAYEEQSGTAELDKDKHYISYKEGADFYSVSEPMMRRLAQEADAVFSFYGGKLKLIDCDKFESFLEQRRLCEYKLV